VCHGPAALVDLTLSDGAYPVAGSAAAFTDNKERVVELDRMPVLVPGDVGDELLARRVRETVVVACIRGPLKTTVRSPSSHTAAALTTPPAPLRRSPQRRDQFTVVLPLLGACVSSPP
jgi:hypothetical protein